MAANNWRRGMDTNLGLWIMGAGVAIFLTILLALNVSARWELNHWPQMVHEEVEKARR